MQNDQNGPIFKNVGQSSMSLSDDGSAQMEDGSSKLIKVSKTVQLGLKSGRGRTNIYQGLTPHRKQC